MRISTVLVAMAAVSVTAQPIGSDYTVLLQQRDSGVELDKRGFFSDWWDSMWKPTGSSSSDTSSSPTPSSTASPSSTSSSSSSSSDSSSDSLTSILYTFSSWLNNLLDSAAPSNSGGSGSGSNSPSPSSPAPSPSLAPAVSPSAAPKKPAPTLTPPAASDLPNLDGWSQVMLATQNAFRAEHNVGAFLWNTTLAQYASDYLDKAQCNFEHSHGPYGENLAIGYPTPQAAVDAWYNEYKDYNYAQGDFSEATGHFTQLVWKGSEQVGCARKDCGASRGSYVVCEYYPRGNIIGRFVQNVFD